MINFNLMVIIYMYIYLCVYTHVYNAFLKTCYLKELHITGLNEFYC